jgi:beta-lactamase regulating signal transducer with metallopeptidase domain
MNKHFHLVLNRMALFTAMTFALVLYFNAEFLQIATANIWLNGVIIGTTLFGIGLCFIQVFKLLPEFKWLYAYTTGRGVIPTTPNMLRPVAQILASRPHKIPASTLDSVSDMILMRFEDSRESVRYITNILIFLGLLGTFWGLILTVGGFAELIASLNFSDESVLESMQAGIYKPLSGMTTAFTSSLLGLAGSLIVGFLGIQVQIAQNTIFHILSDYLSARTTVSAADEIARVLPKINLATHELTKSVQTLEQTLSDA